MSILKQVVSAVTEEVIAEAVPVVEDFAYKCAHKNAAEDQRNGVYDIPDQANGMYDISHVAVLGGEHD